MVIGLRTPAGYSPHESQISKASWDAQRLSFRAAITQIVSALDPAAVASIFNVETGGAFVTLPYGALARLLAQPDPRIKFVQLNEAIATSAFSASTCAASASAR